MKMPERLEMRCVDSLRPYEGNARIHTPEQVQAIVRSMEEMGWTAPILIDGDGNVISGHGRLLAAREIGMEEVPCVLVEHLTEEQRRAYILADNRLAELSCWDKAAVTAELTALRAADFDIALTGFCDEDVSIREAEALDLDEDPAPQSEREATVCHCPKCGFAFEVQL